MKLKRLISIFLIVILILTVFSACGKTDTSRISVDTPQSYTITDSGEKIPFYQEGLFDFNIITSSEDNASYELAKATIFKKARTLNNKRPEFFRDNVIERKKKKSILIGDTNDPISKEAKDILNQNKNNHFNYVIFSKNGNIAIVAANNETLEEAVNYFMSKILIDIDSKISENYLYHYVPVFNNKLQINSIDIAYYTIQCENYPSGMVYKGCEELQSAIEKITKVKIPIVRDNDFVSDSLIKVVKGDNADEYGVKFENGNMVVFGGSDFSINAALHNLAMNVSSIKEKTNIPNSYSSIKKVTKDTAATEGYKLVWSDDFDGNELNPEYWYCTEYQRLNNYRSPEAVSVEDGCAIITSKPTTLPDGSAGYQTGEINGRGLNFVYGYFEMRAKLPKGPGNWASFWAVGKLTSKNQCYPEIDIFETTGSAHSFTTTIHTWWTQGKTVKGLYVPGQETKGEISHTSDPNNLEPGSITYYTNGKKEYFGNDFHTFGCEWTPSYIRFYCDGVKYCELDLKSALVDPVYGYNVTPFLSLTNGCPVNIIIGNLLNSTDAAEKSDETTEMPSKYYIDYVRLYQMDGVGKINVPR